jgi:hypothetical protein
MNRREKLPPVSVFVRPWAREIEAVVITTDEEIPPAMKADISREIGVPVEFRTLAGKNPWTLNFSYKSTEWWWRRAWRALRRWAKR